ncbi:hypothetical protein [Sulfitobacter sp. S190]|uniref:hypothetical protein n=1 Tax=Sulfitobacter sp. S190 TaxID=2867022 RepID=UPI0021A5B3F0|nr:hypothetical protein [Sulfitobacter sp. S190]UWR23618.1 hypothetical protein K3756_06515 [Sulfitobacter sp. S190]
MNAVLICAVLGALGYGAARMLGIKPAVYVWIGATLVAALQIFGALMLTSTPVGAVDAAAPGEWKLLVYAAFGLAGIVIWALQKRRSVGA